MSKVFNIVVKAGNIPEKIDVRVLSTNNSADNINAIDLIMSEGAVSLMQTAKLPFSFNYVDGTAIIEFTINSRNENGQGTPDAWCGTYNIIDNSTIILKDMPFYALTITTEKITVIGVA